MSSVTKALLDMTQLWYQCKEQLKITQATLQRKEQLIDIMKGELEALRVDNKQLRYQLFCASCRAYLDRKKQGTPSNVRPVLTVLGYKTNDTLFHPHSL